MAGKKGKSGRRPRPTAIHLLNGTFRKDHHGDKDAAKRRASKTKVAKSPACPADLPPYAKSVWRALAKELKGDGILERVDRETLAAFCAACANRREAQARLTELGSVLEEPVVDNEGNVVGTKYRGNPATPAVNQAMNQIRAFACEFGLTPAARARAMTPKKAPDESGLEAFRNERQPANRG